MYRLVFAFVITSALSMAFGCKDASFSANSGGNGSSSSNNNNPRGFNQNGNPNANATGKYGNDGGADSWQDEGNDSGRGRTTTSSWDDDEDGSDGDDGGNGWNDGVIVEDEVLNPIDPACALGTIVGPVEIAPENDLAATAPSDCSEGFEFNNYHQSFSIDANSLRNSKTAVDLEIASYTVYDHMKIFAYSESGEETLLLDTCRLRTHHKVDPTNGRERPPEDTIRDFSIKLPKQTARLKFDWSRADSPTYLKISGLCYFDLTPTSYSKDPKIRPTDR